MEKEMILNHGHENWDILRVFSRPDVVQLLS